MRDGDMVISTVVLLIALGGCTQSRGDMELEAADVDLPDFEAAEEQTDPAGRQPQRAGQYYPDDPEEMHREVNALLAEVDAGEPRAAAGILVPHASLRASGFIAAEVYARVEIPENVILIAPNHPGVGAPAALWNAGPWYAPGATFLYRNDLAGRLVELLGDDIQVDREAFEAERSHPPEMQLPFLAVLNPDVKLVAILYYDNSAVFFPDFGIERMQAHGLAIATLVREIEEQGESVMVLATTDLVHHVSTTLSEEQDTKVMEHVVRFDLEGMYAYVNGEEVSICGEIPTGIFMMAMKELGYSEAELLALDNSAATVSPPDDVVGYPGAAVWK